MAGFIDSDYFTRLFELAQGLGGGFFLVVVGVEFEGALNSVTASSFLLRRCAIWARRRWASGSSGMVLTASLLRR